MKLVTFSYFYLTQNYHSSTHDHCRWIMSSKVISTIWHSSVYDMFLPEDLCEGFMQYIVTSFSKLGSLW